MPHKLQATNKRKATGEEEGQQDENGHQRPRKWLERTSRASDINYDLREYYRAPTCTPPAQRAVSPTLTWESCFECIQELCRNPRVMKCRQGLGNSKCRHCDATQKACLKIPQTLTSRLAKIQKIASSIIARPSALGWSDEVSRRAKRLREEYTIFREEMESYIAGADMAISSRASHNVSGVSGSRTAVGGLANARDSTPTAINGGAGNIKTPDKWPVIATLSSPFREIKMESSFGSSPLFKRSVTAKMLTTSHNVAGKAAATSSPPFFASLTTKGDGSNDDGDGDELKLPAPTPSPPELSQNPASAAKMENQFRAATAEANTVGGSIKAEAEDNAMGGDIQAASTNLNTVPFNLGGELLTVLGSIEGNLARIADALEVKNRRGMARDGDCGIGGEMIANRAYWE
ncbi:hypothetical protein ACJ73_00098 [Blastomyces percursus]|uniref:Uncharacterized protein n=1 Tax=Blastomyces percursus TaxID=1658174 RepID=A0A1J9R7Z2_9EURO|nr:hypothetical protein ACJ73_00098 [Blastomyces percursus]